MSRFFRLWFGALVRIFCTRQNLVLEDLALRQQLTVLKRRHPRPRLDPIDKLFWVFARRFKKSAGDERSMTPHLMCLAENLCTLSYGLFKWDTRPTQW